MKILVTGAAGFIGSHVVDLLLEKNYEVWCLDDLSSGKRENLPKDVEFAKVDVGNWWDLVSEFVDCQPDYVIHLAAQPSICDSIDNPIRDGYVNVMGTLNVIRASQKIGVKRLVFSSTSAVYDEMTCEDHLTEDFPRVPHSPYGISKLTAESYVRNLMPEEGTVLRFANVYGPRQVPIGENQIVPRMIQHFEKGEPFFIHGDGEQRRDMVYVKDVAYACMLAMWGKPDVYNIASGISVSVNKLADMMAEFYGVPDYPWQHDDQQDPRRKVCLNIHKAACGLGWPPKGIGWPEVTCLEHGLCDTIEWWKAQ